MKIKKIQTKTIEKKLNEGEMEDGIFCARLEKAKEFPLGADPKKLTVNKLIIGTWLKEGWQWVGLPATLHNFIFDILFKKKVFDKYYYFQFVNEKPHPLKEAYDFLVRTHDYELAHKLNEIIKGRPPEEEIVDKSDDFHIDVQGNFYHITKQDKDSDLNRMMASISKCGWEKK